MKNLILPAAFLFAFGTTAMAQSPAAAPAPAAHTQETKKACDMPDISAVETLGLEKEQLVRVREIQAECERECAAAKAETGSMNKEVMARHEARIQEVLTPEQYTRYQELAHKNKEKRDMKGDHKAH
jgi:hypothetical protein